MGDPATNSPERETSERRLSNAAPPEVWDAAEAAATLVSTLRGSGDEPVQIEAVVSQAKELAGATGAAAKAARTHVFQAAQSFAKEIPTPREVAQTVSQAELPVHFVHAPTLFGLFVPPPQWPPRRHTVGSFLRASTLPAAVFAGFTALVVGSTVVAVAVLPLLVPLVMVLAPVLVPLLLLVWRRRAEARRQAALATEAAEREAAGATYSDNPAAFMGTGTAVSRARRARMAEQILADVSSRAVGQHDTPFNHHVASATGLAVYGCGVLAATHVGALRALERHGLDYARIETYAGVSAGAVVVACLAVGCCAEQVQSLILGLSFQRLVTPELGSLFRAGANILLGSYLRRALGESATEVLERGHGPGVNSGRVLEEMVGEALRARTGNADITLGEVRLAYGKRLVLIATELDSGKERRFTPETDPDLPVRVAVRMSMGIPGVFEPFRYEGHVYCDGGMMNDFPINALPDRQHRLGLCVKQQVYVSYNMGPIEQIVGRQLIDKHPRLREELCDAQSRLWREGAYPTRELIDFATTCVNIMMDANLDLQIEAARKARRAQARMMGPFESGEASPVIREEESVKDGAERRGHIFELAPEILTLCSGAYQPFDFKLTAAQHGELYLAGQLFTHLYAARLSGQGPPALNDEQKLQALLWVLRLDYPA